MNKKEKHNFHNEITGINRKLDSVIEYYEKLLSDLKIGLLIDGEVIYSENFKENLKFIKSIRYSEKDK